MSYPSPKTTNWQFEQKGKSFIKPVHVEKMTSHAANVFCRDIPDKISMKNSMLFRSIIKEEKP
jgi:hypothetical protein